MFPQGTIRDAVARLGDDWDAGLTDRPFTGTGPDLRVMARAEDERVLHRFPAERQLWLASQGMSNADYADFIWDLLEEAA
jgi:hypothetical protein